MSTESDRIAKAQKEYTDDFLTQKFESDMGQKVLVDRTEIDNKRMAELREVIRCVGRDLLEIGAVPKGLDYLGSFSVHSYHSEVLKTLVFATVNAPDRMNFAVADSASRELYGKICESYGRKRPVRRSGAS